ncbi:hypothetical protein EAF04_000672 [Stromatinia cepivora]|nr:hypothetical protein EAF04_000672 [Stromatinia cepivora]
MSSLPHQVCDICYNPHHSCFRCPNKNDAIHSICNTCGHLHKKQTCPFKAAPDPEQYTQERYEAYMKRNPLKNQPQPVVSNSHTGRSQNLPSSINPSPQAQPQSQIQARPPGSIQRGATFVAPAKTEKEVEADKWANGFQKLVHRAATSTNVQHVAVQANYFKVNFASNLDLRRYRIQLDQINSKDIVKRELRRALIKALLEQHPPSGIWVSDYFEYIVSVGKLYPACSDSAGTITNVLHHRPGRNGTWVAMQSSIIYEGSFQRNALQAHVASNTSSFVPDAELRMMNIISWFNINGYNGQNVALFDGFRVGKRFYPAVGGVFPSRQVPKVGKPKFLIKTGFFTSMRPAVGSVLLNVNTATSAFFPPGILHDWIMRRWQTDTPPAVDQDDLIGLRVTFNGDGVNPKTRVIRGVGRRGASLITFTPMAANGFSGTSTNVYDHMVNKYPTLRFNRRACCLNLGAVSDPKWYPADNLRILQGQIFKKQLPDELGSEMRKMAENEPEDNKRLILQGALASLGISATTSPLSQFGFSVQDQFLEVVPKYLRQPILAFKNEDFNISEQSKNKSSWMLRNNDRIFNFANTGTVNFNLHIIRLNLEDNAPFEKVVKFAQDLKSKIEGYGIIFENGGRIYNAGFSQNRTVLGTHLTAALTDLTAGDGNRKPKLLLIVVPNKNIQTYANIKWWGDCIAGIPTICISAGVLTKTKNGSTDVGVISNVSLKINFKLGGTSHFLKTQASESILWAGAKPNTMIVGADVSHAGKGKDPTCPSMAGVVATCDERCSQYLASARLQENNTESIADLGDMIGERLKKYRSVNGALPEHILFYRDGVSESQYGMVVTDEIPLIKAGCKAVGAEAGKGDNWCPKITLLVVGKRHHTRFFPREKKGEKYNRNLESGLLIDTGVVTPNHFSFYLQSHDSALGTAKSAHYIVITNESNYTPEHIQETTNIICFTGSRAFKALSVCTPAKYADILCDRLRCYMKPALDDQYAQAPRTLDFYQSNAEIWNAPRQDRTNPWHPDLDNIMFYL